jgi:hypothetical protein
MRTALMMKVAQYCHSLEKIRNVADLLADRDGPAPAYCLDGDTPTIVYYHSPSDTPAIATAFGPDGWMRARDYTGKVDYIKTMPNGVVIRIDSVEPRVSPSGSAVDPSVFGPEVTLAQHNDTTADERVEGVAQ